MKILETDRLVIRNWTEVDRSAFHRLQSDETVMRFFSFRRDRAESDAVMDSWAADIASTLMGFTAMALRETDECIGISGINYLNMPGIFPPDTVEVGWRMLPEYWGKGYSTEAAQGLLARAFNTFQCDEVVAIAIPENTRSVAVMQRLGMTRDPQGDFMHPRVPENLPALRGHGTWRIRRPV